MACSACSGATPLPSYPSASPLAATVPPRRTAWYAVRSMEDVATCVVVNDDGSCTEFHSAAAADAYMAANGISGVAAMFTVIA